MAPATLTDPTVEQAEDTTAKTRRKLFISYRGILFLMVEKRIEPSDLESGLFYFGCIREHALTFNNEDMRRLVPDLSESKVVHRDLVAALDLAEAEDRAIWRAASGPSSWPQLNELLVQNGFRSVESPNGEYYGMSDYITVKGLVEQVNQFLEVVF